MARAVHHTPCTSAIEDFQPGTFFHRVIDDSSNADNTRHRDRNPTTGEGYLLLRADCEAMYAGRARSHLDGGYGLSGCAVPLRPAPPGEKKNKYGTNGLWLVSGAI